MAALIGTPCGDRRHGEKHPLSSQPIPRPIPKRRLQEEIRSLPLGQKLIQQGRFSVYYADAGQAPLLVREIGRLRESTFREVGEGTGQPIDLDRTRRWTCCAKLTNLRRPLPILGKHRKQPTAACGKSATHNSLLSGKEAHDGLYV
jgi:hypothetical protein